MPRLQFRVVLRWAYLVVNTGNNDIIWQRHEVYRHCKDY